MLRLFLLLTVLLAGNASAQSLLLRPAPVSSDALTGAEATRFARIDDGATRLVLVDARALAATQSVTVEVAPGQAVVLAPGRTERLAPGQFDWISQDGDAVLSVRDGRLMGVVTVPGAGRWEIRPVGPALHTLRRVPDEVETDAGGVVAPAAPGEPTPTPGASSSVGGGTVDVTVMFAYTPQAAAAAYDLPLAAQQALAVANAAFANSGVVIRYRLLDIVPTTTLNSAANLTTDLSRLQNPSDGFGDNLPTHRDAIGADLVSMFTTEDGTSTVGLAYVCASPSYGYGVVEITSSAYAFVFAHEAGHNLGGGHEGGGTTCAGVDYGHGKLSSTASPPWTTVMAASLGGSSIPYFSNPAISVNGEATGTVDAADNARLFNERAATVAAFRTDDGVPDVAIASGTPSLTLPQGRIATTGALLQNSGTGTLRWFRASDPSVPYGVTSDPFVSILGTGTTRPLVAGTCGASATDEGFATVALPAPIAFDGRAYTSVRISANGYVTFGGYTGCSNTTQPLPTAGGPERLIAALWSSSLRFLTWSSGTPAQILTQVDAEGRFVVEWSRVGIETGTPGSYYVISVQLRLSPDGTAQVTYNGDARYILSVNLAPDAVVGIEYEGERDARSVPRATFAGANGLTFPSGVLSVTAASGSVSAGANGAVSLTVDAALLPAGVYALSVPLLTTDPDTPTLEIPVQLTVTAAQVALGDGAGWRFLSFPSKDMTVATLAGQNLVQGVPASGTHPGYYASAAPNVYLDWSGSAWVTPASGDAPVPAGRGVFWYLFDNDFTPTPNEGSVSVALPQTITAPGAVPVRDWPVALTAAGDGWTPLGNPFPAPLPAGDLNTWPGASALASFVPQVWNGTSWVPLAGASDFIPPATGFMVEAMAGGGTLTMPVPDRAPPTLPEAPPVALQFALSGTDRTTGAPVEDRALVLSFREDAEAGRDRRDAAKLASLARPAATLAFGADAPGSALLSVDARPLAPAEIPVHLSVDGVTGALTLRWEGADALPDGWAAWLVDRETGARTDLRTQPAYTFEVTAGATSTPVGLRSAQAQSAARFALTVSPRLVAGASDVPAAFAVAAPAPNPAPGAATMAYTLPDAADVVVTVFDALGRQVARLDEGARAAGAHAARLDTRTLPAGVYVVRLTAGRDAATQRLVVVR